MTTTPATDQPAKITQGDLARLDGEVRRLEKAVARLAETLAARQEREQAQ
jgi:hypothetical protein